MEIIYRAEDGKEFFDEDECSLYETSIRLQTQKGLACFDGSMMKMSFKDPIKTVEKAVYVRLDDWPAVQAYERLSKEACCSSPTRPGCWYYDDNYDMWVEIEGHIGFLNEEIENFRRRMQRMKAD